MTAEEFLEAELSKTQAELGTVILNRGRWDKLRENRQMLVFLHERSAGLDFKGLRSELRSIADGQLKVPSVPGPRTQATDCLRRWAKVLDAPVVAETPS